MAGFARLSRHSRTLVVIPGHDWESTKSWIPDQVGDDEQQNLDPKSGSYPAAVSWAGGSQGGSGRVILATT